METYNELIYCRLCNSEREITVIDDEIVSELPCKCERKKIDKKSLDKFIEQIGELLHETRKTDSSINSAPKTITNSERD